MADDLIFSEAAAAALRLAAAQRPMNAALTTARVLAALARVDVAHDWQRLWLHTGDPEAMQLADTPDTPNTASSRSWENVPLTGDMAAALSTLRRVCKTYRLAPASPGLLALALVADPNSGAATALSQSGLPHAELLEIVEADLVGVHLEGLETLIAPEPHLVDMGGSATPDLAAELLGQANLRSSRARKGPGHRTQVLGERGAGPAPAGPAGIAPPGAADLRGQSFRDAAVEPLLGAWRLPARVLWWLLRPLATLAAVMACVLSWRMGVSPVLAFSSAVLVITVRPVRRLWAGFALAVFCAFVSPAAAVAVAVRTLLTFSALVINGPGWTAGLSRLVTSRRRATTQMDVASAWAKVEDTLSRPQELELMESLSELLLTAWCEADVRELATTTRRAAHGLIFGQWPFGRVRSAEVLLLESMVAESVADYFFQATAAVAGAVIGFLFPGIGGFHVLGHEISRWLAVLIGALVAWNWAGLRASRLRQSLTSSVAKLAIFTAAAYFALGLPGLWVLLASTAMGLAAGLANKKMSRLRVPRVTVSPLPVRLRWRRGHSIWHAGRRAMNAGDSEAANRLWRQLATGSIPADDQIRAMSQALLAGLALDRGAWQESVQWADMAVAAAPAPSQACYLTRVAAARVMLAAGNRDRSVALLREAEGAGFGGRLRRDLFTRMVLARALAMTHNVKEARVVLSRIRGGFRGAAIGRIIETEAAVATMSSHADAAVAAERLRSMLDWVENPQISESVASPADQQRLAIAAARGWLALGDLELRLGDNAAAESSLKRAVKSLPVPAEVANRAQAQVLLGCALAIERPGSESLSHISEGLSALESTRGQLRNSFLRSQLVLQLDDVYGRALDALIAQQTVAAGAGQIAAVLLESLRRDALASLLRGGATLKLDPKTRAIQDEINDLESRTALTEEESALLASLRSRLGGAMSNLYAEAYSPNPVVLGDVRRRAPDAHVLTFKIVEADEACLRGHSVWIPPNGEPFIAPVMLADRQLLAAVGLLGKQEQTKVMKQPQFPGDREFQRWLDLGKGLLPEPLRAELSHASRARPARIVIVPDGPLAAFPWAGVRITDGRHLVEVASIHVIPAMGLMEADSPFAPGYGAGNRVTGGGPILLHRGTEARDDVLALLSTAGDVREARSRSEIESLLARGELVGAYFSVHGEGEGLDQNLRLLHGAQISAASAITLAWPEWLVFASCIVGTLQLSAGTEPTGLVTSCLLGGASSVVAGVVEVHAGVADRICVALAARLLNCRHPADALREAQLSFIASRDTASVHRWGGYICVSRLPPPPHATTATAREMASTLGSPD